MFKEYSKVIFFTILSVVIFAVLGWFLFVGGKVVERQALVNSHQYIEGQNQQVSIFRANLESVNALLMVEQDPMVRKRLMAQQRMLNAQLNAAMQ